MSEGFSEEYVGGKEYGLGNENVDGFFLDDHWSSKPSEESYPCTQRGTGAGRCAGLSAAETNKMHAAWQHNMETVQASIVSKGGFDWQNFRCIDGSRDGIKCNPSTPGPGSRVGIRCNITLIALH